MATSTKEKIRYMTRYESTPKQVKLREERNLARQHALKSGAVHLHDKKEVDHIIPLRKAGKNVASNTRVVSTSVNRSWRKGKRGYDD